MIRRLLLGLLAVGCLTGAAETVRSLRSIDQLTRRPAGTTAGAIGLPSPGTPHVRAIRALARTLRRDRGAWIVILPAGAGSALRRYVRYQLELLEYPARVRVVEVGGTLPADLDEATVFMAPGMTLPAPWLGVGAASGYHAYRLEGQP
ncbi:MAG TPA: hypothetical protein VF178_09035 [Gemmatimonadaceae bacterium]